MILQTINENQAGLSTLLQLPIVASIVIIIGLALSGFSIKKLIQLMVK